MLRRALFAFGSILLPIALAAPRSGAEGVSAAACIDASEQAIALRKATRLRDARVSLVTCAAAACPDEIRAECERQLTLVNQAIPTLLLQIRDDTGADVPGVSVGVDGKAPERLGGVALELDPGEHVLVFTAEGRAPLTRTFVLRQGERDRHESVVLESFAPRPAPSASAAPSVSSAPSVEAPAPYWTPRRVTGAAVAGTGAAGLAAGSVLGLVAWSASNAQKNACPSPCAPPQHDQAVADHGGASSAAIASNVAFGLGAAALAAGLAVWLTAPSARAGRGLEVAPAVDPHAASLSLRGAF